MGIWQNLLGTLETSFRIGKGKATLDASGLTAARSYVLPDKAGTMAIASDVHDAASKTTPVDADEIGLIDSAASNVLKKLTWVNLKATIKTYFDTLYAEKGSGGTVTQATSKTTTVTLNKFCGQITMNAATLAAGAKVVFNFSNSLLGAADGLGVFVKYDSVAVSSGYRVDVYPGALLAQIAITNTSGASLSEAVVLNFQIARGAVA